MKDEFLTKGWCRFPYDPVLANWIEHILPAARETVTSPDFAEWHRCEGTWFVGVNALPNNGAGAVPDGPLLAGQAVDFIRNELGIKDFKWDRAQISVCYPGYPKPMDGESEANFAFRRDRDAAHVDGLRHKEPGRRRFLQEPHGFVLGIPLVKTGPGASPVAVWEGSHHPVREALKVVYDQAEPETWNDVDITDAYHAVRREIFKSCERVVVHAEPGEAYLIHRHALHGISPWQENATAGPDGRMIAYFRPETGTAADWMNAP